MTVPLRHSDFGPVYSAYDNDGDYNNGFELSPGERIGGPINHTSDRLAWCTSVVIMVCAGCVLLNGEEGGLSWVSNTTARVIAAIEQSAATPNVPATPNVLASATTPSTPQFAPPGPQPAAPLAPPPAAAPVSTASAPPTANVAPTPATTAAPNAVPSPGSPAASNPAAAHETAAARADNTKASDLPAEKSEADAKASDRKPEKTEADSKASELPPVINDTDTENSDRPEKADAHTRTSDLRPARPVARDRYQQRAESVGLNPELSRAVLARFSATDYRNARVAIETAMTKTPDNGVFIWPRQHMRGQAIFKVHFVPGGGADCRRYVVTVTMDGWTTTAPPMEKCGVRRGIARRD